MQTMHPPVGKFLTYEEGGISCSPLAHFWLLPQPLQDLAAHVRKALGGAIYNELLYSHYSVMLHVRLHSL